MLKRELSCGSPHLICNFAANYPHSTLFSARRGVNPAYRLTMSKRKPRNNGRFRYVTAGISTTLVLILVGTVVFFGTMADNLSRALSENFTV